MPFVSDEQRKAVFAKLNGRGGSNRNPSQRSGGGGGRPYNNSPRPPKAPRPKKPKTPKVPTSTTVSWGSGAVGYAGNYTQGVPNYGNWYTSLANTTNTPPLAGYSGMIQGGDPSIPQPASGWDPNFHYGARELTDAEKIGLGIPIAVFAGWVLAPAAGALTAGGVIVADVTLPLTTSSAIMVYGAQGGALAYSGLALSGLEMSIMDAPTRTRNADGTYSLEYRDLVSWFNAQPKGWIPRGQ